VRELVATIIQVAGIGIFVGRGAIAPRANSARSNASAGTRSLYHAFGARLSTTKRVARLLHATPDPDRSVRTQADKRIELTDEEHCKATQLYVKVINSSSGSIPRISTT
jgi:hypothetical protein